METGFDGRESRRFQRALVVALGLHALALLGHAMQRVATQRAPEQAPQQLWIDVRPSEQPASVTPTGVKVGASRAESAAVHVASRSNASAESAAPVELSPPVLELPVPSASSSAGASRPLTLEQLGIGFDDNPLIGSMPPPTDAERAELERRQQALRARQIADGEKIRRARGVEAPAIAPLLSLIRTNSVSPDSTALLLIRVDENGRVVGAKVLHASSDAKTWRRVARALAPALRGKRLSLRTSSGIDLRIRADTFLRMPSGTRSDQSGSHWAPLQFSQSFDLSDIGSHPVLDAQAALEAISVADHGQRVE